MTILRLMPVLCSVEWGATIKGLLIAAACIMLAGVSALLVIELIGKRAIPSVVREGAVAAADPSPQPQEVSPEEAAAEEVALTEQAVLIDDDDNADSGTMVVGEKQVKVRYNRSFAARLVQADDMLKGKYSQLKNELLRYGLKARQSWENESYYRGRRTYAKFAIRGKTLSLYLALDPQEYDGTKYNFRDVSAVAKYHDVPMQLRLKSARSVRWAIELLAALAQDSDWKRTARKEENFRPDYRNTATLVHEAFIKLYYVADATVNESEKEVAAAADLRRQDRTPREFTAKLMRADSGLKERYSAVKNELLRFGLKPHMSIANESWRRGRTTYAKFAIRGKTLLLFMALDPQEFEGTKYHFNNVGEVGKYGKVPMRIKLKSERSVRWVKELIATMAQKKGWERTELQEEDFRYVDEKKR